MLKIQINVVVRTVHNTHESVGNPDSDRSYRAHKRTHLPQYSIVSQYGPTWSDLHIIIGTQWGNHGNRVLMVLSTCSRRSVTALYASGVVIACICTNKFGTDG